MRKQVKDFIDATRRAVCLFTAIALVASGMTLFWQGGYASAAVITSRSVQIGSSLASASTDYKFSFVPATAAPIQGLKFQACTTALGSCTAPAGLSFSTAGATGTVSTGSTWTTTTNFAKQTGSNDCVSSASILCANRTAASNETGSTVRSVTFTTVTNPNATICASNVCTYFIRITTYNNNTWTVGGIVDNGTVATSLTSQLTVNAFVQEQLTFCVGQTSVNNATSAIADCTALGTASVNLGTLTPSSTSVTPVTSNGGDGMNAGIQVSTNAANGTNVYYSAVQQSGTNHAGALRVAGQTCNAGTVVYDSCINSQATQATITANSSSEVFGMTIAGINCQNTNAYSCVFSTGVYNLQRDAEYDGNGANTFVSDADLVGATTNGGYAWNETANSATQIASSASSTIKVIDKETLILKFAASPALVTPTGSYTAKADFVAAPAF